MADETVAKVQTEDTTQESGNVLGLVMGDMATKTYLMTATSVDDVTAKLSLDSKGIDYIESEDNKSYLVDAHILVRDPAGQETGTIRLYGYVSRGVGAATMLVNPISSVTRTDIPWQAIVATLEPDTTTGMIDIKVTGVPGYTFKWVARAMITETGISV